MSMTMEGIMRNTPPGRVKGSTEVRITHVIAQPSIPSVTTQTYTPGHKDKYKTSVAFKRDVKGKLLKYVQVSCSCPDFMYTWEVALHNKGAAPIMYSNGEPPEERNPKELSGVCKHLYAVMGAMLRRNTFARFAKRKP